MDELVYLIQAPPFWLKTPPLALAYLENYIKNKGLMVKVRDLNIELFKLAKIAVKDWLTLNLEFEEGLFSFAEQNFTQLLESLYAQIKNYELIGFSLFKRNVPFSFSLANKIKEIFPEKNIIFGGPEVLFLDWQKNLAPDYSWVIGEGEIPLYKTISGGHKGIYRFEEIDNLDNLPFLDFNALNLKLYSPVIPLISSRGCPNTCNFCTERKLYQRFRFHSPEYIVEEIKCLVQKYKTNNFIFCDSLINYNNKWLQDFCSLVIKNKLNIKWEAQMRVYKKFSRELGALMKKSGCYNLFVGLESGSNNMLRAMNKGFNLETALDFFKSLNKAKLQFEISLIFGYPGETEGNFRDSLDFIRQNKKLIPKIAQANPFVDYLGDHENKYPLNTVKSRIRKFLRILELEKIRYTKSFINNLIY